MTQIFKKKLSDLHIRLHTQLEFPRVLNRPAISSLSGWMMLIAAMVSFSDARELRFLFVALRRFEKGLGLTLAQRFMRHWLKPEHVSELRENQIGWKRYYGTFADISREPKLNATLLLKEPGPGGEKGVVYSSFEYNWMKIVANHDARAFFRDYYLVGATSWSPSDYAVFANLCGLSDDPIFIGICNPRDIKQYQTFSPDIYPLPIMGCDWEDPDFFRPRPHKERTVDIVMVSHFARWKRHWLLFEALKHMPKGLNVVLIGREGEGRTAYDIRAEAQAFGVPQDLTILTALDIDKVMEYQCNAKVSASLSQREGCCVSVTEAMFADTPVVMMGDAHVGPRAYINSHTGEISTRRRLHHTLCAMLDKSSSYAPRKWACDNISANVTSHRLNSILRDYSIKSGKPWTRDIAPLCWRYVPQHLYSSDAKRLSDGVKALRERHGIELEQFISEADARRRHKKAMA